MFNFTPEERRVVLFLLGLTFCGLVLANLIKLNSRAETLIFPRPEIAKINLNKASLEELTGLKSISPNLAKRIIEYRDNRRSFASLEELKDVKGIGERRYEKLKDNFFIE